MLLSPQKNNKVPVPKVPKINILSLFTLCALKLFQNLILLLFSSVETQKEKSDAALLQAMTTLMVTTIVNLQKAPIMTLALYSEKKIIIKSICVMSRQNYLSLPPVKLRSYCICHQSRLIGTTIRKTANIYIYIYCTFGNTLQYGCTNMH